MTTPALLYRPNCRSQVYVAFGCAAALYLAAIALARSVPETPSLPQSPDGGVDAVIDPIGDQAPVQPVEPTPTESSEFVKPDEAFPDEKPISTVMRPTHWKPLSRFVRPALVTGVSGVSFSSVKVLAIYAPRPEYPYEARRQRTTGSCLVVLTINPSTGSVTDARTAHSTGSLVLDNSAVNALRDWRFKSGTVAKVQVPITYTLSGASY